MLSFKLADSKGIYYYPVLAHLQVLMKTFKTEENVDNYLLLEDVQKSWDHREIDKSGGGSQRVLDWDEKVLQAQSKWKGSGRLILRKSSSVRSKDRFVEEWKITFWPIVWLKHHSASTIH